MCVIVGAAWLYSDLSNIFESECFMKMSNLMLWVCLVFCILIGCSTASAAEGKTFSKAERLAWFNEARFGMFIHWGLYSNPAGEWKGKKIGGIGEWIQRAAQIAPADYEKLKDIFNPVKFDADAWAKTAKEAGMKYIVITTKHHDGFALFDSKVSDYDVMSSPFKRDILEELSAACRKHGIRVGWYHSILDWHHPDYLPKLKSDLRAKGDHAKYKKYLFAQVKEILTQYGKIDMLWFDGEWDRTWTHADGLRMYEFALKLQPELIINNRVDKGRQGMAGMNKKGDFAGDFGTPEQEIPATGFAGESWESCMTMNDTWGFKKDDHKWKSVKTLIRNLINTSSKGGNFLLNVGPTGLGEIPEPSLKRLASMGEWLQVYGDVIYATTASPFKELAFKGRCTVSQLDNGNTRLNLFVFDKPRSGKIVLYGVKNKVLGAKIFVGGKKVVVKQAGGVVTLDVSGLVMNGHATVVMVELAGSANIVTVEIPDQDVNGDLVMESEDGVIAGHTLKVADTGELGFWINPRDRVRFLTNVTMKGRYKIYVTYSCHPGTGGTYELKFGHNQVIKVKTEATTGWSDYKRVMVGEVDISRLGHDYVEVAPIKFEHALMNLKRIEFLRED